MGYFQLASVFFPFKFILHLGYYMSIRRLGTLERISIVAVGNSVWIVRPCGFSVIRIESLILRCIRIASWKLFALFKFTSCFAAIGRSAFGRNTGQFRAGADFKSRAN